MSLQQSPIRRRRRQRPYRSPWMALHVNVSWLFITSILMRVLIVPHISAFLIQQSCRIHAPCNSLRTIHNRHHVPYLQFAHRDADLEVQFGSSSANRNLTMMGGSRWGVDADEDDEEEQQLRERRIRVQQLVEASEQQELNRNLQQQQQNQQQQNPWGNFITNSRAPAPKPEEVNALVLNLSIEQQANLAARDGVTLEVLVGSGNEDEDITMDPDLAEEWLALNDGQQSSEVDNGANSELNQVPVLNVFSTPTNRRRGPGVRVGSAGGWTLEVFPGDFVVHRKYGIGKFVQTTLRPKTKLTEAEKAAQSERRAAILKQKLRERSAKVGSVTPDEIQQIRSIFGTEADTDPVSNPQVTVLEIAYADGIVHVPVDRAYRISRYRSGDAKVAPKLSRVRGGDAWAKAKQKVEANTVELAQDVLALYATRETLTRAPFDPAKEELVQEFSQSFPFTPTPDQIQCFEDVETDMVWRSRPMDRLVCGDVGFGKTEVAVRAIFRCIVNGQQAALLAPTGVLAAQHYKTMVARMGPGTPYNVTVGLLRGGMATKSGRELRQQIQSGEISLVVGTHALLSNNIVYNNLGLLVIDEEQRFGVKQKERLKLICNGVDVLTLSATPIPRTLQMSLSGIRDTSTIRSPPPMRKPTITYVQEFSESMVQKAIQDELDRGGQCYYVVPRISMIREAEEMIQRLFPSIRIIHAHGRLHRNGAENNVALFAEGKYDVLLATTVIENGVDIPSVNTIIVQNSQAFGMSTLYQLRGRVGRSDKQAYAYFLHREETITEQASMRLQAIGELHELGSGFDVANRDLEIRGAGSLLGTEQSGMAARVGFDLYMRMLKKSIRKLRGLDLPVVPRTNILIPTEGTPSTFRIPASYVQDDKERKSEESKARLAESTASLVALTNEWKEKYGPLPTSLQNQLKTLHLHACTRRLGIDLVGLVTEYLADEEDGERVDCVLRSPGLRPRHWAAIVAELPKKVPPKGLDVIFPSRFTSTGEEEEVVGGEKIELKALLLDDSLGGGLEDDDWDSMDQEEIEAMKDISSAVNVKDMDEIDLEQYPRFVVKDFGTGDNNNKAADRLLKLLLPVAKIVYQKQQEQATNAKAAAALRERREQMRERKRINDLADARSLELKYGFDDRM